VSTIFIPTSEADDEWNRNPFTFGHAVEMTVKNRAAHTKPGDSALSVEMTLIHDGKQVAVVNGRKVGIADTVEGATVTAISMDSVSFVKNGKTVVRSVGDNSNEAH
jgi:chromosome segregation ATPase